MNIKTVHAVYFSGTGTTEKVVTTLAKDLAERLGAGYEACCFNLPEARKQALSFGRRIWRWWAPPVYAGPGAQSAAALHSGYDPWGGDPGRPGGAVRQPQL